MTCIAMTRRRLEDARSLAALLDAAYQAFEDTMTAIRGHEDSTGDSFAAFAFAAAAAADGRDAIAAAPSLPRTPAREPHADVGPDGLGTGELAASLAGLSAVLAARLARAAVSAEYQDRTACRVAARQAGEIHALLAGNEP